MKIKWLYATLALMSTCCFSQPGELSAGPTYLATAKANLAQDFFEIVARHGFDEDVLHALAQEMHPWVHDDNLSVTSFAHELEQSLTFIQKQLDNLSEEVPFSGAQSADLACDEFIVEEESGFSPVNVFRSKSSRRIELDQNPLDLGPSALPLVPNKELGSLADYPKME